MHREDFKKRVIYFGCAISILGMVSLANYSSNSKINRDHSYIDNLIRQDVHHTFRNYSPPEFYDSIKLKASTNYQKQLLEYNPIKIQE